MTEQPTTVDVAPLSGYTPPTIRVAATYPAGAGPESVDVEVNLGPTGDLDASEFVVKVVDALARVPARPAPGGAYVFKIGGGQLDGDLLAHLRSRVAEVIGHAPDCDGNCDQDPADTGDPVAAAEIWLGQARAEQSEQATLYAHRVTEAEQRLADARRHAAEKTETAGEPADEKDGGN